MLAFSGSAAAEESAELQPNFWVEPNYDFSQVRRVCVLEPEFAADVKKEDYSDLKKMFFENARMRNVKMMTMNEVMGLIKKDSGIDVKKMNSQDGWKIFLEQVPKYADVMIDANIIRCGVIVRDSPVQYQAVPLTKIVTLYEDASNVNYGVINYWGKARASGGQGESLMVATVGWKIHDLRTGKAVIVATEEGNVPTTVFGLENNIGGLNMMKNVSYWKPKTVFEKTIQGFFGELGNRINK